MNIHLRERGGGDLSGTVDIDGTLDVADALDLETALADRAHELKLLGSEDSCPSAGLRRWVTSPACSPPSP